MTLNEQLQRIARKLQPQINKVLRNDVANAVRAEEIDAINKVVYGSYSPYVYQRRESSGGLSDPTNIRAVVDAEGLHIWNNTPANPGGVRDTGRVTTSKYLALLVERGNDRGGGLYDFPSKNSAFMDARPFTQTTVDELKKNGKHVAALKSGLKNLGIEIK